MPQINTPSELRSKASPLALLLSALDMGFRNLLRHKVRNFIIILVFAFSGMAAIIFFSLMGYITQESVQNYVRFDSAAGQILSQQHIDERKHLNLEGENLISYDKGLQELIARQHFRSAPRVEFSAKLIFPTPANERSADSQANERAYIAAKVIALDPALDSQAFGLQRSFEQGSSGAFFSGDEEGIIVGSNMAGDMGLGLGDKLMLSTRDSYGSNVTLELPILGILNSEDSELNKHGVFIPLATADWLLDLGGKVSFVGLMPESRNLGSSWPVKDQDLSAQLKQLQSSLSASYPNLRVQSWQDMAHNFLNLLTQKMGGIYLFIIIMVIICLSGVLNSVGIAMMERKREIATLKAMGMNDGNIRSLFICESAMIGLLGGLLGIAFGVYLNSLLVNYGLDYTKLLKTDPNDINLGGFRVSLMFYGIWDWNVIFSVPIIAIILNVFSTMHPTRRVLKINLRNAMEE